MILVTKTSHQTRVCVCVCVFIKLHITAQSGPVILVKLYATRTDPPKKGGSMILVTKTSDQARQRGGVYVCFSVVCHKEKFFLLRTGSAPKTPTL